MGAAETGGPRREERSPQFPAYGPIEALLGYLLFFVLVDRTTPAIVETFSVTVLDLAPSFLKFGLAAGLWFVFVVTAIDQTRRQLAALGVVADDDYRLRLWSRVTPASLRTAGYLLALVVGTAVAAVTFDPAVEALLTLIPVVASAEVGAFDPLEFVVMIIFFVAYSLAAHSLDRLVIDGVRRLTSA